MPELTYPVALLVTLVVELPIWSLLGAHSSGASRSRALAVGVLVNLVSHPLLWFVLVPLLDNATGAIVLSTALAEGTVVLLEAVLAWRLLPTRLGTAVGLAFVANGTSLAVGLALWRA